MEQASTVNIETTQQESTPKSAVKKPNPHVGIYVFFLLISLGLILLMPVQSPWVETTRGWYTQPMLGSLLGLSVVAFFSLIRIIPNLKTLFSGFNPEDGLFNTLSEYRVPILCCFLFYIYIQTLSVLGFFLATLLFVNTLLFLSGLFNRFWLITTFLMVVFLVVVFRVGLSLWLPEVWLYQFLPENLMDLANQYL